MYTTQIKVLFTLNRCMKPSWRLPIPTTLLTRPPTPTCEPSSSLTQENSSMC